MTDKLLPDAAPLASDAGVPRDDHRPLGAAPAGIAPGQIDAAAAMAADVDGAGEPLPSRADRAAQGLGAGVTADTPQPATVSGDNATSRADTSRPPPPSK